MLIIFELVIQSIYKSANITILIKIIKAFSKFIHIFRACHRQLSTIFVQLTMDCGCHFCVTVKIWHSFIWWNMAAKQNNNVLDGNKLNNFANKDHNVWIPLPIMWITITKLPQYQRIKNQFEVIHNLIFFQNNHHRLIFLWRWKKACLVRRNLTVLHQNYGLNKVSFSMHNSLGLFSEFPHNYVASLIFLKSARFLMLSSPLHSLLISPAGLRLYFRLQTIYF